MKPERRFFHGAEPRRTLFGDHREDSRGGFSSWRICRLWRVAVGLLAGLAGWPALTQTATHLTVEASEVSRFEAYALGPSVPVETVFVLSNASELTISWAAIKNASWISCHPAGGLLPPLTVTNVLLFPNGEALKLAAGTYAAEVCLTNHTFTEGSRREVEMQVRIPEPGTTEFLDLLITNQLQLRWSGEPGTTFVIEASTNFFDWDVIESNVFKTVDPSLMVEIAPGVGRYFRAVSEGDGAVPAVLSITKNTTNDLQRIEIRGDPGGMYRLEYSELADEQQWIAFATNQIPADGTLVVTSALSQSEAPLEYRATGLDAFPLETAHQVLIAGQSLAFGAGGAPSLSTEPSDAHSRIGSDGLNTFVTPLVERGVETMASSLARHVSSLTPGHRMVIGNAAVGGAVYDLLKKGTPPYERSMQLFRQAPFELSRLLLGARPEAIFVVHGEGDHINPEYDLDLREWQRDYETDVRNVTGLEVSIPMFHSQASAWTSVNNGSATYTLGAFKVLAESEANPGRTILVCPKYYFIYVDGIHLTNTSYRWLGEYYAKAYHKVVVEGQAWTPLKPLAATRTDQVITARFHVPFPPLILDTNLVSDPGNFGFEYFDDSGNPPAISQVDLIQPDTVILTLSSVPAGSGERLRYAFKGIAGNDGGPLTGPRGNLRDSDPEPSLYGNTLYNWCVHFDQPILNKPVD